MSRFKITETTISDLRVIERNPVGDDRGYLERLFCSEELKPFIGNRNIQQINHTLTAKSGTVRGMHYQNPPHAEMKLVSCLRGEVFDVAVDLRKGSPTFLKWHAVMLSEANHLSFAIPEGFAHGFQALTDNCELLYFHTAAYEPSSEAGLNALDPRLAIEWPQPVCERSVRDQQHRLITPDFLGVAI